MKFRDYQVQIINQGSQILRQTGLLYLGMQVRTGKTLTSLGICSNMNTSQVLFLTKKKAINGVLKDYKDLSPNYSLHVINYESIHKIDDTDFDVIIIDEAHSLGAFPKPSGRAKQVKELIKKHKPKVILLSGTPTPESYSQMYHQVYGIPGNPFSKYVNFYKFASDHVNVTKKKINGFDVNDYSQGLDSIMKAMEPLTINFTQSEAGFNVNTVEHILTCRMNQEVKDMVSFLKKNKVVLLPGGDSILADTGAKMMSKIHQLCSGTVRCDSGKHLIVDYSKAEMIKDKFKGQKIGIFYKFIAELEALKKVFSEDLCFSVDEFDSTDKNIALQIVSGREGISLKNAESLVFMNIDFSATSYWQARDRMTTIDRLNSDVYWIFSDIGMEIKILNAVSEKKNYTLSHFKTQFLK